MLHLTPERLVELAEADARASDPHLVACDRCRAEVEGLRSVIAEARHADVPEPSPLFWNLLSERINKEVAAEGPPSGWWFGGWTRWRLAIPLGACLAVVVVALVWRYSGAPTVQIARAPDAAAVDPAPMPADAAADEDPSFTLIANLASTLDVEDAPEAGLATSDVAIDRTLNELTTAERAELRRILEQELSAAKAS